MESRVKNLKSLTLWKINLPDVTAVAHTHHTDFFGYDPGTSHCGIAWTNGHFVTVAQVELERTADSIQRMNDLQQLLMDLSISVMGLRPFAIHVIEGASFSDKFRQVELAEARTTIRWWAERMKPGSYRIIPPNTIRRQVFGNGRMPAQNYWDADIPNDALAALSCLYYAKFLKENEE